jgi:hypothetical protein
MTDLIDTYLRHGCLSGTQPARLRLLDMSSYLRSGVPVSQDELDQCFWDLDSTRYSDGTLLLMDWLEVTGAMPLGGEAG